MEVKRLKKLLRKYQIRPSKRLGQNFLIDKEIVKKVIGAADLSPEDVILEIGPGLGVLTIELAKKAKKVITIEKDQKMIEILKETLTGLKNVEVIKGDILKFQISDFGFRIFKVVANLPFYLTAPVIRKFLETNGVRPHQLVLVVQKEVGQRICAKPPDMSILAVSVQFYAQPKIISYVSKKSFWPQPKVDSAIIKITPISAVMFDRTYLRKKKREKFFKIVRAGFSQPRKQLINNLSKGLKIDKEKIKTWLLKNNIQPKQRAETLSIKDWLNLTKSFKIK